MLVESCAFCSALLVVSFLPADYAQRWGVTHLLLTAGHLLAYPLSSQSSLGGTLRWQSYLA